METEYDPVPLCELLAGMFCIVVMTDGEGTVLALCDENGRCRGFEGFPLWGLPLGTGKARDAARLRSAFRGAALRGPVRDIEVSLAGPGGTRILDMTIAPIEGGGHPRFVACGVDVTARVVAERSRRETDERLRMAMDAAEIDAWELDVATGAIVGERRLGMPPDASSTLDAFLARLDPVEREGVVAALGEARRSGDVYNRDLRIVQADGTVRWVRTVGRFDPDRRGRALKMRGIAVDVTRRKVQELAFKEASDEILNREGHLRSILATVPVAMVVTDKAGVITMFSAAAEALFGWKAREVLGRGAEALFFPDPEAEDAALPGTGLPPRNPSEVRCLRKDGTVFPAEANVGTAGGEGGRFTTTFFRDLTERHATEARLVELTNELSHVSRLSAMGHLASMLAHELNQPLAAATNYVGACSLLLERSVGPGERDAFASALGHASEQMVRAGRIISNLRDFVARRRTERRVECPAELVEGALVLGFVGGIQDGVSLRRHVGKAVPNVLADRVQVQQVLVNLIRNALEAMAASQRKILALSVTPLPNEGAVRFAVSDTGGGIAPEVAEGLFTPFATTKADGIGVGLSICRTIVEAHGGRIWVEEGGRGTTFCFTLAATSGTAGDDAPASG